MATGIFATVAEVQRRVNVNASATSNVEAYIDQFTAEAEAHINATIRFNFSDVYSTLNVDVQGILKMAASELAASMVEAFDPDAIGRNTFNLSTNIHIYWFQQAMTSLKDKKKEDFINKA